MAQHELDFALCRSFTSGSGLEKFLDSLLFGEELQFFFLLIKRATEAQVSSEVGKRASDLPRFP